MPYLLVYDIRGTNNALRMRLNRKLHQCRAEQIQQSVWKLENPEQCRALARLVNSNGGRALVVPLRSDDKPLSFPPELRSQP